jgi:hypothetical protein
VTRIGVFSNGTWYFDMNGNGSWDGPVTDRTYANFGVGLPNAIPVVGDWDGTGVTRIGVFSNGTWYLDMNGNGAWGPGDVVETNFGAGLPNVMPVVGDWDGTGVTRIGVFSNGTWYLDMNGNGSWDGPVTDRTYANFGVGLPNAKPVVGDWSGSANPGTPKIGVFSNGTWYLDMNGNGAWNPGVDTAYANFGVGLPNAKPIVGRW